MEHTNGYGESESAVNFKDLPIHVLFIIFEHLDLRSLFVLCSVCKNLYGIINYEYLNLKSASLLITNQFSVKIQNKSLRLLSGGDKYRLNFHWRNNYYNENIYLKSKERFRPWLHLESNNLFISRGSEILSFKRCKKGIGKKQSLVFKGHSEDVVRFAVKDGLMISGGNDGKICCWKPKTGKLLFYTKNPIGWNENLYVDFSQRTLVSGFSVSGILKLWTIKDKEFTFERQIQMNARLRTVKLSEDGMLCAVGSSGYKTSPLNIFDLNREVFSISISENFKPGAGIFDIIWETPNVFLTCGYDTYVRLWDLRTGQCVRSWTDPFDNAIYSLATDYNWTIMSGSGVYSRVTLWDKRRSSHVLIYHMTESPLCGPVYSFDFDPRFMFVALDSSLHVLDFSTKSSIPHIL
ncbi:hypothetical protein RUM43_007982 [Polyplax serrata]|uniref:F-box domain-containing protein n=1 Tax=Polyplax serrata TaxID=468196 RepID=A0AAN8S866_POLSC